jgi:AraC family transcriptional regulator of adaptative response/methylated-DNA-[protein]-cysteine methyltransferase
MVSVMERPQTLNDEACWQAVLERRKSAAGLFVIAVRTTKIFCRPTCPARTPKRENVEFYRSPRLAEDAGYRACKRCRPADQLTPESTLVRDVCKRLTSAERIPSLDELGAEFGLSKYHLQRVFRRAVGITPREYAEAKRLERAKKALRNGNGVAGAVYDAGYGSSSRLYERSDELLGMTPARYQRLGEGMRIGYTIVTSTFGRLLVGATERGVSAVSFSDSDEPLVNALFCEYEGAEIVRDDVGMRPWVKEVLRAVDQGEVRDDLPLDIRATAFRMRVLQELRRIPRGETRTYGEVARAIGAPKAARAVGNACHNNPVAVIIPCHRVVAGGNKLGGYGGGIDKKVRLLEREGATVPPAAAPAKRVSNRTPSRRRQQS